MSSRYSSPNYTEDKATFETDKREQIDKNLPKIKLVTLREWLAIWLCLDQSRRLRRAQITFNDCRPLNNQTVHQLADVDSMIGVVPRNMPLIPVPTLKTVKYYMMRSKLYTLTSDLHIGPVKVLMDDRTLHTTHHVLL
ncbi:valine-tRNA ligase [Rhizoctonia solani]|uniref:Valine-tRNA ligase n=1 Tax=Rhizoctonia solani TaxID=456999 RepID=A0A8H8P0Z2_9AGAM|nr:valine-tRNA ligase [Rhizoctonia solani]QRW21863.1 valine-tRNA ligase [Rhizoctonia solani]